MTDTRTARLSVDVSPCRGELVDGTLTGSEARDLLQALLATTRNHHKLRNLRSQVSRHAPDADARGGLERLEVLQEELLRRLELAGGGRVRLRATLELEVEADSLAEAG